MRLVDIVDAVLTAGPSPWEVLGLKNGAGVDEVKRAHRELSSLLHPDKHAHSPSAAAAMAKVNAAYDELKRPERRSRAAAMYQPEVCGTCKGAGTVKVQKGFGFVRRKCQDC